MPLGFPSLNHGVIAFGFFNIDTDLLLLEHYFLFAPQFCGYMERLARDASGGISEMSWEVNTIDDPADIGDLMGAIHGVRHLGFIGDVYRRFPFPVRQEEFKQRPEGDQNRAIIETLLESYAQRVEIPFRADPSGQRVEIGEYRFSRATFLELIHYIWLGGYPRWRDGVRPGYVLEMKKRLEESPNGLFEGLDLA
ncbi:MAG: hypothetical protein JW821_17010 [Deltaproteobacteria bacterium]|nr:hypothetical protein [Deltaproteobacteria bacterium]